MTDPTTDRHREARKWNTDKPHRCPTCHAVVIRRPQRPRWWRAYTCLSCGTCFTRFPWLDR